MITVFRLTTTEEVIGDYDDNCSLVEAYSIKKPYRIMLTEEGVGLMPVLLFSKGDSLILNKNHVMYKYEPNDALYNGYKKQTGGILKVEKPPLKLVTD